MCRVIFFSLKANKLLIEILMYRYYSLKERNKQKNVIFNWTGILPSSLTKPSNGSLMLYYFIITCSVDPR